MWYGGSSGDGLGWFGVVLGHDSGSRGTLGCAEGVGTESARYWLCVSGESARDFALFLAWGGRGWRGVGGVGWEFGWRG